MWIPSILFCYTVYQYLFHLQWGLSVPIRDGRGPASFQTPQHSTMVGTCPPHGWSSGALRILAAPSTLALALFCAVSFFAQLKPLLSPQPRKRESNYQHVIVTRSSNNFPILNSTTNTPNPLPKPRQLQQVLRPVLQLQPNHLHQG